MMQAGTNMMEYTRAHMRAARFVLFLAVLAIGLGSAALARTTWVHDTITQVISADTLMGKKLEKLKVRGIELTHSGSPDETLKYISAYVQGKEVLIGYDDECARDEADALPCDIYFVFNEKPYSLASTLVAAGHARWAAPKSQASPVVKSGEDKREPVINLAGALKYDVPRGGKIGGSSPVYLVGVNSSLMYEAPLNEKNEFAFTNIKPYSTYYLILKSGYTYKETYTETLLVPDAYQGQSPGTITYRPYLGEDEKLIEIFQGYDGKLRYRVQRSRTASASVSWHLLMSLTQGGSYRIDMTNGNVDSQYCGETMPYRGSGIQAYPSFSKANPERLSP